MLSECVKTIELEFNIQKRTKERFQNKLKELKTTDGIVLIAKHQKKIVRYFLVQNHNGKYRRIYLNKSQDELRKQIQQRYYLERAIPLCQKNIEMLDMLRDSYYDLDPREVLKDAPLAYKDPDSAAKLLYGVANESRWKERKLKYKARFRVPYPEGLQDLAEDGTMTRSKSEALIINLLNQKGIPYVYECPLYLGNKRIWPDFVIWDRKNNRELLIEHMGMMDDYNYRADQTDKLGLYIQEGYVPNVNLLLTFDDKNGKINVPAISKMIDAILNRG